MADKDNKSKLTYHVWDKDNNEYDIPDEVVQQRGMDNFAKDFEGGYITMFDDKKQKVDVPIEDVGEYRKQGYIWYDTSGNATPINEVGKKPSPSSSSQRTEQSQYPQEVLDAFNSPDNKPGNFKDLAQLNDEYQRGELKKPSLISQALGMMPKVDAGNIGREQKMGGMITSMLLGGNEQTAQGNASQEQKQEPAPSIPSVVNDNTLMDAKFANYLEDWKKRPDKEGNYFENFVADLEADGMNPDEALEATRSAQNRYANRSALEVTNKVVSSLADDTVQDAEKNIEAQWYSHDVQDKLKQEASAMGISYDDYVAHYLKPAMVESLVQKYGQNYRNIAEGIATRLYSHDEHVQDRLMNQDINDALSDVISKYVNPSVVDEYNKAQEAGSKAFNEGMEGSQNIPASLRLGTAIASQYEANQAKDPQKTLSALQKKFNGLYKNPQFLNDMSNAAFKVMQRYGMNGTLSGNPKQFKPMIDDVLKAQLNQLEVKNMIPKGSLEYIINTGLGNTIVGKITRKLVQTDYQNWLEDIANQQYQPGFWERVGSGALTFAGDAWSYWLPGAAGGKVTKSMLAKAEGRLASDLMAKGMEAKMAERAAKVLIGKSKGMALKTGAAHGAVTFGGQSAISKPIDEIYRTGQLDENGKVYNPSVGKILANTLGEVVKQSAVGAIMQGGTIANMVGKGRGLATNILADVGGKVVDSSIMTGQQMLERMAQDPSFKPTGKDAAESFLESMANLTSIGLPGMVGKYARFKDAKEFNRKFDFNDQDIAELKRFGYDDLRDAFEKLGINGYRADGEGVQMMGQLTDKYMNLMNDKSVPEVLKAKMMAVVEGKRPSSFSPVIDSIIVQPMDNDGKVYLETLNKDGGIIDRKEYSSLEEAQKAEKKLDFEKSLNITSEYEKAYHTDALQDRLNTIYEQARDKYAAGEQLSDEDKAAIYLHQNASAIGGIMQKQQKGMELTEQEQQMVNSYRHFYDSAFENSPIMKEYVRTFEDSRGVEHGTLRKALEGDGKSRTAEQQKLVEEYQKQLYNDIVLKREMNDAKEQMNQNLIEGQRELPGATQEGGASAENAEATAEKPVDASVSSDVPPTEPPTPPVGGETPTNVEGTPLMENGASPSDANTASNESKSNAFVMGQNAYQNGDAEGLKAIDHNDDVSKARLKRAFGDDEAQMNVVVKAYEDGKDMEQFVAQSANSMTPAQQDAVRKYVEAQDAKKGVYDALQHADDGYGDALKELLWTYQTEDGNIVPATLTTGQQVFLKKANEYGGGFVVVPDEDGNPAIKQVSSADIKEVGTPVPMDDYINQQVTEQKNARQQQFFAQYDGSGLKPSDTVEVAMEAGEEPMQMTFAGYSEDGKIVLSDGKDNIALTKDEFNTWRQNALDASIGAELDAEDAQRANDDAAKAEADKKQRYNEGIVGLGMGQPDYSSKDTEPKVAAEYLQEQFGNDHGKLMNLISGSRSDIKEQLDNKRKAASEYEDWLSLNADLDPEKAQQVENDLALVNEQIADLKTRYKNWNAIRKEVMTPEEARTLKNERKAEIEKAGVDDSVGSPSDEREVAVLDNKELKKQYPTMDEASNYIASERKRIYHIQNDEVQPQIDDINEALEQYMNGDIDYSADQLKELNTTKAQLEARQANLSASAKDLKAQDKLLNTLYSAENKEERAKAMEEMTPSEQRKALVAVAFKKNDLGAIKEIYKDASVDVMDLTPQTLEEAVSESLSPHSLNPESLQYELGKSNFKFGIGKRYDSNKFNYLIAKKGTGMSVNEFAVRVFNDLPVNLQDMGYSDQDVRNTLLDMFKSYDNVKDMRNVALMNRIAAAEEELSAEEEWYEAQKEREIIERQAEIEEYNSYIQDKTLSLPSESELNAIEGMEYDRMMEAEEREREYKEYVKSILLEIADYDDRSNEEGYGGGGGLGSDSSRRGVDEGNRQGEEISGREASSQSETGESTDSGRTGRQETGSMEPGEGSVVRGAHLPQEASFGERLKNAIAETEPNPSEAQKKAGNYKKGHLSFGGYDFTVETPKGTTRSGKDEQGKPWSVTMHDTYGYILGKIGVDGDHIDMFINDAADLDSFDGNVYVVDQVNPETGEFDEHKVMYGYPSEEAATEAYLANYSKGWKGLGKVTAVPKATFDKWLESSDRKTKPFADYAMIKKGAHQDFISDMEYTYENDVHPSEEDKPKMQKFAERLLNFHQDREDKPEYGYTVLSSNINGDKLYPSEKKWFGTKKYRQGVSWVDKENASAYELNPRFNAQGYLTAVGVHKIVPLASFNRDVKEVKPSEMTEAQKVAFDAVSTMLKKAGIPVKVVSNEDMEKVAEAQDNLNLAMLLNQPEMRFKIKTPEEKQAAENAYNFAKDLRPNKWAQYAVVDMSNPNKMPEYYQKQELARKERTYLNRLMWGNYKVFNLDKSFEDNVAGLTGSFPSEFDPYKIDEQTSKKNELKKQMKETEEAYKLTGQERKEYQNQLMKEYMDEHGLASENDIPDDVWREFDYKAIEKYQDKLDSLFARYKDLDRQLKAIVQPGVRFLRTYHGTGASFDKFDLSHALEGEGSESFGHGVYVTNSSKIGREYAQRAKNRKMEDLYKNMRYPDGVKGDIFKRRVFGEMVNDVATGGSVASAKEFAKKRVGADANDIQRTLENLKDREKGTEYEQNLKDRLAEYKEGLKWIDSLDEDYLTQGNANRYDVDIPDDNGSNYLDWEGTIPDSLDKQKVAEDAYKVVSDNQGFNDFKATPLNDFIAHTLKTYVNTTDVAGRVEKLKSDIKDVIENYVADDDVLALNEYLKDATPDDVLATIWYNDLVRDIKDADLGEELYRKLSTYVGDNAASQILSDNGLVGIKYPAGMIHGGAKEGDYNYVIFDENNANIVGNTKFAQGKGVVYGYTDGKEIVLNQEHLNPNTPIHEYQHLWRTAAKKMNPELIEHGDKLIMQTQLFADLKEDPNYKHLSDDEICDEAFARLTGEDGAAILEQMAKDAIKENPLDTAKELTIINRLKNWLKKFWYWTLNTFTKWKPEDIKKMTLEDIRNLVLRDLANGVDPRNLKSRLAKKDAVEVTPEIANTPVNIVNAEAKHGFKNYAEAREWAKKNIVRTYNNEETGGKGEINISNTAVGKYLSEKAVKKTANKDVHMSVLKVLPSVLRESIDAIQHVDRNKVGNDRSEDFGINPDVMIHRCYGAVNIGGKVYGVKITLKENVRTHEKTKLYSYEATKIELLDGQSGDVAMTSPRNSNNSITVAKIIKGFETTKENGKKFSLEDPKTLAGVHNISEEKLLKAIKQGGLANPSVAVIDTSKQNHESYGDISLILPSDKVAKRTGKNAGTWQGDAWTPTYPQVEKQISNKGSVQVNKDVLSVPKEMQHEARNGIDRWILDGNDSNSGLKYLFLHEKGVAPKMVELQHKYSDKVYNGLKSITSGNFDISSIGKADTQKVLDMYIDNVFGGDRAAYEEKQEYRITRYKKQVAEGEKNPFLLVRAKNALEQYDKYGFYFDKVQEFVRKVERDHRMTGVDTDATLNEVEDYIKNNNLTDEFNTWLEGKEKEYGIKEVIFDGFTPSGNRRYVPNTLENVSKIMKKQGRNGATGSAVSFQNFAARLMPSYGTLKDIRSKKGLLTSDREEFDKFRDKWSGVFYELGMKCQPDATGTFEFYGLERLSEAAMTSDPQAYLKKEYNVDFSDEDTKRLKEMVKAIKEEQPAMYFETKFERPVSFDEFSSAVVPATASNEVKQALQNAGVQIYEYDKQKEGDRKRAFNEAINSNNEIRFHRVTEVKSPIVEQKLKKHPDSLMKAGTYFSGGGLVEEGLKGIIDTVVAVEYDRKISGVYRNNFGQHIVTADVRDVDPKELVKHIDGEVEYFHASPVCKNYSQANSNGGEVELDKETAKSTADFIDAVKPRVVTIENVKGYKDSEAMKIITQALDKNGYKWDADVYNAADYGGYTSRERLIVRAVKDGELPEKPKKQPRKGGWLEAVEDILPTLTEKKSGVAPWMDARLKVDGIDWQKVEKPLYVMGSAYADGKIPHAYGNEILPTLRTKSGDVIIMPGGKVLRADGRVLARITGLGDDYLLPKTESLAHTIIGNGIPVQLTKGVIAPLLNKDDLSGRNVLARLGSSIFKNNWDADMQKQVSDRVVNTANKLGGAEATVYTSVDEVPDAYLSDVKNGATGWYDPTTHTVHVYLPNCADADEAQRTVFHEKIGHEGMEVLLGGEQGVRKFADFVYKSVDKKTRGKILDFAYQYDPGWNNPDRINIGTQEYIAHLAEEGPTTAEDFSLWTKIKHYLIKVLKKLGIRVPGLLNDKDLRYYLMKAGKALHVWDNMPKTQQEAMMAQASNAEIKDALADGAGKGKPRQKKGESAIQYMKRVMEWKRWKEAREDTEDPEPPMFYDFDKDAEGKKEWERLNKEWRDSHGLRGEEMPLRPERKEGESDDAFMNRYKEWEKWNDAMGDKENPMPDMFSFEKQKQDEARQKYEDWLTRHELNEQNYADLDLYEGKIYPAETNPEADALEQEVMQDLAEVTSTDVSKEGAATTVKHAVIHRRKNMEEASADDAIYINDVKNSIEKMAESGAFDKLLSDYQGKPNKAEKLAEAIPYIIEAPRRIREIAYKLNSTGVFGEGHIHITPDDVEAIQELRPQLAEVTANTHTEIKDGKEVKLFDDMKGATEVASKMADIINGNHEKEPGFVPIDGTDILNKNVLPIILNRITPYGVDYKNLSEPMKSVLDSIRDWYNYTFDWLKDNNTLKADTGFTVDYVNHLWDKEKSDKNAYAMYVENRQRTKSPNEKPRLINTIMEGLEVGLVPKTTDITKMMAYYSRSNIEAWANKTMLQEVSGLNVIERNEDGEIISSDPLLSSVAPFNLEQYKYFEIPGVGPVWVYNVSPKQMKVKNPITGKDKVLYSEASAGDRFGVVFDTYQSTPFWKAFDTLASSMKKLELGFSGFHAGALTEVYMVQNMVEYGPKKALANFMKYIFADTMKNHQLPCFANPQDFQEAATHLVKFGATNDYAAADVQNMFDNMRDAMMKVQEKLKDGNGISGTVAVATMPLKVATQMLSLINKGMDRALWDFLHDGLKLATYRMRADKTKERAKKKGWTEEELSRALDEDGQFVNDMFGGQHWDVLGASHRTLRYAGRVLLSPDWNASTTRHFLALTGYGSVWNEATLENFKEYYKRLYHKNLTPEDEGRRARQISSLLCYGLGFMVFYEAIANGINAAFRALDEEKERKKAEELRKTNPNYRSPYELAYPDGMKWYDYLMRGNSLGQQSKIFMGRYADGTEMYIRHGKQFREVPEYLFNHKGELEFPGPMVQRMIGKANPMVRMTLDDINYLSDFQASHADQEIQRKYGKTIGLLYKDALYWAPFLIPSQENKEFKAVDFFFPSSKGFSPWKAQSYFKDFILSGDMEGVVMTYQSCERNGIDPEEQIKAAIGSVKALESAEMKDGITSLQVASERFDEAKSITEKKKMRQKMKKFLSMSAYKAFTQKEALDMVQSYLNGEDDLKEMEKAENKYLMKAKSEDVTEDWRIQAVWNGTMETYDEYLRLKDVDKAKANAFKNSKTNKRLFAARKAISAAKKKMNKAKKQMDGQNDAAKMVEIRKTRKELIETLNGME